MTLLEKFREADKYSLTKPTHDRKCEDIADEYAIEFANWFVLRYTEAVFYRENYTVDLLQEFKKEKGL